MATAGNPTRMSSTYSVRQQELTAQFYAWEILGRGWLHADHLVELEPPFTPFFGHFLRAPVLPDDGVRPTLLSSIAGVFKQYKQQVVQEEQLPEISYAPFPYSDESELISFAVLFPSLYKTSAAETTQFLSMLSYVQRPVSFEIHAGEERITMIIVCREDDAAYIEAQLHSSFHGVGFKREPVDILKILQTESAYATVDFGLKEEFMRPLNLYRSMEPDSFLGMLSLCQYIQKGERIVLQVLFNGVMNAWQKSIIRSVSDREGNAFFADAPEMLPLAKEKVQQPLFACTIRAVVFAPELDDAFSLLHKIAFAITRQSQSGGNCVIPLSNEGYDLEQRMTDIAGRTSHRLGMLLNISELAQFVHFPSYTPAISKLFRKERKTKAVPDIAKENSICLGNNNHQALEIPVTISTEQRTKHTHIIGATGTGKSTLIAQLALQDIKQGRGIALFDPHGDLIEELLGRIPEQRMKDVILIDPADSDYPVGINLLQAHNDIEREILSSDLVASFKKLSTSWGDQMNAVLGNAILVFLESNKGGTLHDLRRFLVEREFRNHILATITDPSILYYWQKEYPLLKTNSIGPILTRLDTFLRPRILRNMVIQSQGIDFAEVLAKKNILLVKLSQGLIGTENSFLLGSLILSKIHQAAFARQREGTDRTPYFIYIDEFQHFVTPSVKDMLSGIRKYNIGLILSHQELQQVQREDADLLHAVLANAGIRIVFRTGEADAKKLAEGFSSFDYTDLLNLGKGEAIVRIEQPQYDCSLDTILPEEISIETRQQTSESIRNHSRSQYAMAKEKVEQILLQSHPVQNRETQEGHRYKPEKDQQPVETKPMHPVVQKPLEITHTEKLTQPKQDSTHRYLQMLIKRMAESKGYTATLEVQLPDGSGSIDLVLQKDGKQIAVEVSVTTDASWELHNIEKCVQAAYTTIISVSGDLKQVEKIKKLYEASGINKEGCTVLFLTPDALFALLEEQLASPEVPEEQVIKGYRVKVSYDAVSQEELQRKRSSIAKVIAEAMRKQRK